MAELGKVLIFFGVVLIILGALFLLLGRTQFPIGRLPGDIIYRGKNTTFYFPLATSIILSVVLSIVLYVIGRFRRQSVARALLSAKLGDLNCFRWHPWPNSALL